MFSSATLKSVAWKFLYGLLGTVLAAVLGVIQANPDPAAFTITAVKVALLTAAVAFVKKFAVNLFVGQ